MIIIQYIYVFLYVCSKSMFTYSKGIRTVNYDYFYTTPIPDNNYEYYKLFDSQPKPKENEVLPKKIYIHKAKRSLELVEEQPPEATYRPQSDEDDDRITLAIPDLSARPTMPTMPSGPSMPSMPSMPSGPSMPSMPSRPLLPSMPSMPSMSNTPTLSPTSTKMPSVEPMTTNSITTTTSDVEILDTTTEDYGDVGEPKCDYDPFQFILKCGLSLITSIFGLSDTCCKPLF